MTVLNVWIEENKYKKAFCRKCEKNLQPKEKIVSVAKVQGSQRFISNYHLECAREILDTALAQSKDLMINLIKVSEELDTHEFNKGTVSIREVEKTVTKSSKGATKSKT